MFLKLMGNCVKLDKVWWKWKFDENESLKMLGLFYYFHDKSAQFLPKQNMHITMGLKEDLFSVCKLYIFLSPWDVLTRSTHEEHELWMHELLWM